MFYKMKVIDKIRQACHYQAKYLLQSEQKIRKKRFLGDKNYFKNNILKREKKEWEMNYNDEKRIKPKF